MGASWRSWRFPGLLLAAVLVGAGCNGPSLLYFLYPGPDPQQDPEFAKLASDDKDKEVKVLILAYSSGVETRPEFLMVDHELTDQLSRLLQQSAKENKKKISVVPPRQVRDFKSRHPDWYAGKLEDVGKHFDADYVIYLEIDSLSLYETGSHNTLYRGRAKIFVTLVDMHQEGYDPARRTFVCEYPVSRGPVPVAAVA